MASYTVGDRIEKLQPWRWHGAPDDVADHHQGTVTTGRYDYLGYITVAWDDGAMTAVHPWDVQTLTR